MISTLTYQSDCYIPTSCGDGGVLVGDEVKLSIKSGYNELWPDFIIGTVSHICGKNYTIDYITEDLNGGPELKPCLVTVSDYTCCNKFEDMLTGNCSDLQELDAEELNTCDNNLQVLD